MSRFVLPEGFTVEFKHERRYAYNPAGKMDGYRTLLAKGGRTEAIVLDTHGDPIVMGIATCSDEDAFNKSIGRQIALGRALKALHNSGLLNTSEVS